MRKVTVFPAGFSGCAWWRIRNPLSFVQKKFKDIQIRILDTTTITPQMVAEECNGAELIVLQSPGSQQALDIINFYKKEGKKVIVDYDDYSFDLSPFNPRYQDLGTKEAVCRDIDGNITWEWKDGYMGFDLKSNQIRFNVFKEICGIVDGISVTTHYLADKFRKFNKNVWVIPNGVDLSKWKSHPRPDKYKNQIRVGWFGGDSHFKDVEQIKDCFFRLIEKYPQVKIVLLTPNEWPQIFGKMPKDRIEYHPWAQLEFYTLALSHMHWDIGLCPVEPNEFSFCKSNIKWQEYGAMKVPCVMTECIPYTVDVNNYSNGICVDNNKFFGAVSFLIENEDARKLMGEKAHRDILAKYNLDINCKNWYDFYISTLEGSCDKELTKPSRNWASRLGWIPSIFRPTISGSFVG